MNKLISIIIPLYNAESYIQRCINSIVDQSAESNSYELIVINDGSTDSSQSIVEEFQKAYPFIQLINKENGGLSSARNCGLELARGNYILFIDADDWIELNALPTLLKSTKTDNADIILFGLKKVYTDGKTKRIDFHLPKENQTQSVEDYICDYTILSSAWQGLFKRSLFTDHDIRMPEGFLAEDDDLVVRLFSGAKTIRYEPIEVYNYYQRPQSISNSTDKIHNEKLISDRITILKDLDNYIKQFKGKRRCGLQRKLDFLALDIIRLLIRKSHSKAFIKLTLSQLTDIGYYPLPKQLYSNKYKLIRIVLNRPSAVAILASIKKSEKFF